MFLKFGSLEAENFSSHQILPFAERSVSSSYTRDELPKQLVLTTRPSPKDPDPTVRCALAHASTIIAPWGDHAMTTAAGQRNRGLMAMAMDKLIQLWVCTCWSASFFWQGHQTLEALLSLLDDSHYEATGGP